MWFMKKFIRITGILGAGGLVMSAVFKINHLMGAPELLLMGTVSTGLFIIGSVVQKLSKK
ncbi:MAG: hypothetical protein EBY63_05745 [Flavobacteriia bacterium]|nr:hypothetical protein [Flavobacteriia bacterium]